jgi:hypothetical protein
VSVTESALANMFCCDASSKSNVDLSFVLRKCNASGPSSGSPVELPVFTNCGICTIFAVGNTFTGKYRTMPWPG